MSGAGERDFVVYGFRSTHDALAAEQVLEEAAARFRVVPSPKALGALCGIAVRVLPEDVPVAEAAMVTGGVEWTAKTTLRDR